MNFPGSSRLSFRRSPRSAGAGSCRRLALGILSLCAVAALAAEPCGPEIPVNSDTMGSHGDVAIARAPGGGFLAIWSGRPGSGGDEDGFAIEARGFDTFGLPTGLQFQVNAVTTGTQSAPALAVTPAGFVAAWSSDGGDGDVDQAVRARRLDAAGAPAGGEFQVNAYTTGYQRAPSVGATSSGAFVVVWSSYGSPGDDVDGSSVQAQRFDASGAPLGAQFQVNSYTTGLQVAPSVAVDPGGSFVVAWTSFATPGGGYESSIEARRYDPAGAPLGDELQVSPPVAYQYDVRLAAGPAGGVLATWTRSGDVLARRMNAAGTMDAELVVNADPGEQYASTAVVDEQDGFVVAWTAWDSSGSDHDFTSTQLRRFDADAQPLGGHTQVNTTTAGRQGDPAAAGLDGSDFVIAYSGYDIDDPQFRSRIWAQRFAVTCVTTTTTSTSSSTSTSRPTDRIAARRLVLREGRRAHAGRVGIRLLAADPAIVPDPPGGPGDPTTTGGRLRLRVAAWGVDVSEELAAAGWRRARHGWRYRAAGEKAVLRKGKLHFAGEAEYLGLGATDPTPIEIAFEVGGRRFCTVFGPGTAVRSARSLRARHGAAPAACAEGLPP